MGDAESTSEQVLRAVQRLVQYSTAHSKAIARETGLSVPQLLCLRAVDELAPENCTVAQVAERAGLSLPTGSRLLTRLVDTGYLRREYVTRDRRKVFVALTDTAREKMSGQMRISQADFVERFTHLDADARMQMVESLNRLVGIMESIRQTAEGAGDLRNGSRQVTEPGAAPSPVSLDDRHEGK